MLKYLVAALAIPAAAAAHAQLERAVPPVGSTVAHAPGELQMSFSERLEPRFTTVTVTDAQGRAMTAGALHLDPADGAHLLVPVRPLGTGTYTVRWHAVSVDTHRTQGTYSFTVGP